MNKLLLLEFLILLCLMNALSGPRSRKRNNFPLRCNHCEPKMPCISEINSCLAGPRQVCKTVKIHFNKRNYTAILTCTKECKPKITGAHSFQIEVKCCDNEDYCNVD